MSDATEKMERALVELPLVDGVSFRSRLNPEYTREHFIASMIPSNVLRALHNARKAREVAYSWRDFTVGAASVALKMGGPSQFQVLAGINVKPDEHSEVNVHAEQLALRKARTYKFDKISIVAVVGQMQPDQQSGYETRTLHTCGLCRTKLGNDPMIDNDATLIFSALPDLRTIEVSTINGLNAYHHGENPDQSGVTLFELSDMEMLSPYVPSESGVEILSDSPQQQQEDAEWTATIGAYMFAHQLKIRRLDAGL